MNAEKIRSAAFWGDKNCAVAGYSNALVDLHIKGGCVLFRTSGSTAQAKWITLSKDALLCSARAVNEWLDVNESSVWGLALPMDHVGGFGVAARAHAADCHLSEFEGKWDPAKFVEWLEREAVTHVSLVPTQVHDLLMAGLQGVPTLKAVVVGGGKLKDSVGQAARDAGWPVLASYGMTEAGSQIATQSLANLNKPFAECELEVLPIWEVKESAEGLLMLKGEALFVGILARGNFIEREGEWFTSNDRVSISGQEIKILGRADSMVKVMGELVDVEAVEKRFLEIAGDRIPEKNFAMVALPDARKEHSLVAVFEGEIDEDSIEKYNQEVSGVERLDNGFTVEEIPRSSLGKIKRGALVEMCQGQAAQT